MRKVVVSGINHLNNSPSQVLQMTSVIERNITSDPKTQIAMGKVDGQELWNKFGYNFGLQNGVTEAIQEWGGDFEYYDTAEIVAFASSSALDSDGGTGCQSIVIYGVDDNWLPIVDQITTAGVTPVNTNKAFKGINRISNTRCGSGQANAGKITGTGADSGFIKATMPALGGTSQQMFFYIYAGYQYNIEWIYFNAKKQSGGGSAPEVDFTGWAYSSVSNSKYEIYNDSMDTAIGRHITIAAPLPFPVGEKSVVWFDGLSDQNNTSVRGRFSGILARL